MLKLLLLLSIMLFLNACGGVSQHEPREEKRLYFKDAPPNGINYVCGERRGVTKSYTKDGKTEQGLLKCIYTPITFSLGGLTIGTIDKVVDGQTIFPQDLVNDFDGDFSNQELLKIAIILQSLGRNYYAHESNISKDIKEPTLVKSLDKISMDELNSAIKGMGITPVTPDEARVHLILNSPNTNSGKPKVEPFEEDISTELMVGSSIGQLSIKRGDGEPILPFLLKGEGEENFMLNAQGKIALTQRLNSAKTYNLTATVANEFGYDSASVTIHVKESGRIGKTGFKDATVKLFKLNSKREKELVATERTSTTGNFDLNTKELEEHGCYIYELSGGVDMKNQPNSGVWRLIVKGSWVKSSMHKIAITPLSEMLYTYVERDGFDNLEPKLEKYSQILLKKSLDSNSKIDAKDIMIFNPPYDKNLLYSTLIYNQTYESIAKKIQAGDTNYRESLFNAYIVESFQSNAIEIVGSSIYTIDMLGSGEFNIYDLETKERIGGVKLPNTPFDEDTHVLYVDLIGSEVRVSSLEDWSYEIDISNQRKPILINEPFIKYSMLSGSFNQRAIGFSHVSTIFSIEKKLYLYNFNENLQKNKIIKFFNIDNNNDFYQYEFDSQLLNIDSLWTYYEYLYVIGDNKINIFKEIDKKMQLNSSYTQHPIRGNILGVEEDILYILDKNRLTLLDVSSPTTPKFIEEITVPFSYKLGIKTNGKYITTGSKIIDIKSLRASKISK